MTKSNGINKINIAVFISGTGSNLKNLIKDSRKKNAKYKVCLVVSNHTKAKGLNYASRTKIKKKIYNFKNHSLAEKKNNFRFEKESNKLDLSCGFYGGFIKKFY